MSRKKKNDSPYEMPEMWIDNRVESYKQFFDYDWGGEIMDLTAPAPKLKALVHRMAAAWKIASNTAAMPWLMNESLRQLNNKYNGSREAQARMALMCQSLNKHLMRVLPLDTISKLIVAEELGKTATRMRDTEIPKHQLELSGEWVWEHFIDLKDFKMFLWGTQYQAFNAVYLPYDHFLGKVVRIASGNQGLKVGECKALEAAYSDTFGPDFAQDYITFRPIHEARLVRHAIVHCGGEEHDKLRDYGHSYKLHKKHLQIYPEDIRNLFNLLKSKIKSLCEHCVTMKQFGRQG